MRIMSERRFQEELEKAREKEREEMYQRKKIGELQLRIERVDHVVGELQRDFEKILTFKSGNGTVLMKDGRVVLE